MLNLLHIFIMGFNFDKTRNFVHGEALDGKCSFLGSLNSLLELWVIFQRWINYEQPN